MEDFLTPKQIAEKLQIGEETVLRYLREGKLKAVKLKRLWRIKESQFQEFIESMNSSGKTEYTEKDRAEEQH